MANVVLRKLEDKEIHSAIKLDTATYAGTYTKTGFLAILVFLSAIAVWMTGYATKPYTIIVPAIMGFVFSMIICFKPTTAPTLAPLYAILEGMTLGAFSYLFEHAYPGIAINAVLITCALFFITIALYSTKVVKVTEPFVSMVAAATMGICAVYFLDIILMFFGIRIPLIHESGLVGIVFSLVVVGIATLNLFLDFKLVSTAVEEKLPKHMEWFCAFGLVVTLVWLYIEILDLLRKFRD